MSPTLNVSRKSLSMALALAVSLAAPAAFAQSETMADPAADPAAATPPAADAGVENNAPAGATSWDDLDADMDGRISKSEAELMPALGQVFDQADADADGALTAEEYQGYVSQVQSGETAAPPEG